MTDRSPTGNRITRRERYGTQSLIDRHKALVRRIAWHVHSRMSSVIEVEDLMQIGFTALVEAAQNFEERGIAFSPYASTRIRGAMIDCLRREARMCRAGMANRRYLAAIRSRLEQEYMRSPSDAEMVASTGVDSEAYFQMVATTRALQQDSIDESYSDHDMWFADLADGADTMLEKAELRAALVASLGRLSEREAMVLQLYFVEEMNLDEIGATLGVGAARVCQIKKIALDKMKAMMGD